MSFRCLARHALACLLMLATGPWPAARADTATDRLHGFFTEVKSLRADFVQTLLDADGKSLQESTGSLMLQRPGKFRWDYHSPYEQVIVGDGRKIWTYDSELAQVTVRDQDQTLGSTPAMLLAGVRPLEDSFAVRNLGARDALTWLELKPRAKTADFTDVRLGFGPDNLQQLELVDAFGQTTRIRFSHIRRNPELAPALFTFTPPAGVDVIGPPD